MDTDLKALWLRERNRREALWELEALQPGAAEAKAPLATLAEIDREDLENPIGHSHAMSIDELREAAPETRIEGTDGHPFVIVLDQNIPQPWRARFEAASVLSTRLPQGSYASDWRRFLRLWVREMEHLKAHRERIQND